jgi:SAM-dependent MidA family methyltransferase
MFPNAKSNNEDHAFLSVFHGRFGSGPATFADFMDLALYHPEVGYYRSNRHRVGFSATADFYTSTSTGEVFGELVAAAAVALLAPAAAGSFDFVEIGAEPGSAGVIGSVAHPFRDASIRRIGDELRLDGDLVVFSNELFDAQPCHRLIRHAGAWCELGVSIAEDRLVETALPSLSTPVASVLERLPNVSLEGYRIDLPIAAGELCARIAAESWRGLFLAFDYGKTWSALATDTPAGTLRAYSAHRQQTDILARPGRQDLTCHICWDLLEEKLQAAGFTNLQLQSQEAFLIRHAGSAASKIAATGDGRPDPRRSRLHELLHPGLLGQRFQVLSAVRN